MKSRLHIPRQQPKRTPRSAPLVVAIRNLRVFLWAAVTSGGRNFFPAKSSMKPPNATPEASEKICPIPAAANVAKPNFAPIVAQNLKKAQQYKYA